MTDLTSSLTGFLNTALAVMLLALVIGVIVVGFGWLIERWRDLG